MNVNYPHKIRDRQEIPDEELAEWIPLTPEDHREVEEMTPEQRAAWLKRIDAGRAARRIQKKRARAARRRNR